MSAAEQIAGMRQATLAPFGQVQTAIAETGQDYVRTAIEEHGARGIPGTDLACLADGYAAVTAIRPPAEAPGITIPPPPKHWSTLTCYENARQREVGARTYRGR